MTRQLTLAVVTAGLSEDASTTRLARALAKAASDVVAGAGRELDVRVVNLRDIAHGITDMMLTGIAPAPVRDALDTVLHADGLIAATPTYKASYSGLFKSFFDLFDESSLTNLPTVVAATGGTPRHSLVLDTALRPLLSYLKALVLPIGVYAAAEDWGHASLQARIDRAGQALASVLLAGAAAGTGSSGAPASGGVASTDAAAPGLRREVTDEFSAVPSFEDLLASVGQ